MGYLGHYWDWFHLIYLLYLKRHTRMRVSFLLITVHKYKDQQ